MHFFLFSIKTKTNHIKRHNDKIWSSHHLNCKKFHLQKKKLNAIQKEFLFISRLIWIFRMNNTLTLNFTFHTECEYVAVAVVTVFTTTSKSFSISVFMVVRRLKRTNKNEHYFWFFFLIQNKNTKMHNKKIVMWDDVISKTLVEPYWHESVKNMNVKSLYWIESRDYIWLNFYGGKAANKTLCSFFLCSI